MVCDCPMAKSELWIIFYDSQYLIPKRKIASVRWSLNDQDARVRYVNYAKLRAFGEKQLPGSLGTTCAMVVMVMVLMCIGTKERTSDERRVPVHYVAERRSTMPKKSQPASGSQPATEWTEHEHTAAPVEIEAQKVADGDPSRKAPLLEQAGSKQIADKALEAVKQRTKKDA